MSLMLAALAIAAAAPGAVRDAKPLCRDERARPAHGRKVVGPHKLGEEPNADAVLTVLRTENGCATPVRVRRDVGLRSRFR